MPNDNGDEFIEAYKYWCVPLLQAMTECLEKNKKDPYLSKAEVAAVTTCMLRMAAMAGTTMPFDVWLQSAIMLWNEAHDSKEDVQMITLDPKTMAKA